MVSYIDIGTEMEVPGRNSRVMRVIILIDTVSFVVGEISCISLVMFSILYADNVGSSARTMFSSTFW